MKKHIEILRVTRENILKITSKYNTQQLNEIPKGFNNSIAWNLGHIVVVQQQLIYGLSNTPMQVPVEFIERFKKGSVPSAVSEFEIKSIKQLFFKLVGSLKNDFDNSIFGKYNEYPTSYHLTLKSVEEAIIFNNIHEALHFGYIMAMKKAL